MRLHRVLAFALTMLPVISLSAKDIASVADWNAFVAAANGGDWSAWKDAEGVVNIVSDLEFPKGAPGIESSVAWNGILDGHGHTFTQKISKLPIIINIGPQGVVRNMVFAGSRRTHHLNGWASVIAVNSAGLVENCHSKVEFALSGKSANVHGLVRTNTGTVRGCTNRGIIVSSAAQEDLWVAGIVADNQGVLENCANFAPVNVRGLDQNSCVAGVCLFAKGQISNCVNEGPIDVELVLTGNRVFYCGGVLARGECRGKDAHFVNCRNKAAVKVVRYSEGDFSVLKSAVAGVLGCVIDGNAEHHLVVENCFNDGPVTLWENEKHFGPCGTFAVGGIVGRVCPNAGAETYLDINTDGYAFELRNCRNAATIEQGSSLVFPISHQRSPSGARFAYTGGIAGVVYGSASCPAVIENCINTGAILSGSSNASDINGGIAGGIANVNMSGCMSLASFGPCTSGLLPVKHYAAIGGVAGLIFKHSVISDCQAKVVLNTGDAKVWSQGFVGAVVSGVEAEVTGNCAVSGSAAWGKYLPGNLKGEIKVN